MSELMDDLYFFLSKYAHIVYSSKILKFEYRQIFKFIFNISIIFPQSQLLLLPMNKQSWKFQGQIIEIQQVQKPFPNSQFIQQMLINFSQEQKGKSITIANFFECTEQAQFVVAMAKFTTIFNIDVDKMQCLDKLTKKELSYIKQYNFQSVLADTNRKQFTKFFQKTTIPILNLSATFCNNSSLILIIQNPQNQQQKYQIKILNYQNLIHSILTNIKLNQNFQQLNKFIDQRYKKVNNIICYHKINSQYINKQFIEFLTCKFSDVVYVVYEDQKFIENYEDNKIELQKKIYKIEDKNIMMMYNENVAILGNLGLNRKGIEKIYEFFNKYWAINVLISKQIQNSKISKDVFKENQLCISFYGIYYNFISLKNLQNIKQSINIQQQFMQKFINQKFQISQKLEQKILNRKLGHYPTKIEKERTKVCCVCDGKQKKKTRYKCQKCSQTYSRDIAICIDHYKQYHENIHKYIPKGVRKGAYKNQISQFKEVNCIQKDKIQDEEDERIKQDYKNILQKWTEQSSKNKSSLFQIANFAPLYFYNQSLNVDYINRMDFIAHGALAQSQQNQPNVKIEQSFDIHKVQKKK